MAFTMNHSENRNSGGRDRTGILVVIPTLAGGGAERVVSRLTREWARTRHVTLALFDPSDRVYDSGGRVVDVGAPASGNFLGKTRAAALRTIRLMNLMRKERPDRIFSFMESANFPTIAAAALTGRLDRLYVSVQDDPASFRFVFRILIPLLYRGPAGVVAASEGVKRGLESAGVPAAKLSVIPNPVASEGGHAVGLEPPPSIRFILGVGRLDPQKGFDRLLAAAHGLDRPDLHLVILGKGGEHRALVELAHELGMEERVHFPGWVPRVEAWYRRAECFVLSSHHEGWPNVLMEAIANGCPAVSFDCRYGPREIVEDGKSGLLVTEGDIEGLTKAIARVLDDGVLRRSLAANGVERMRRFGVEGIAARWLALARRRRRGTSHMDRT